MPSWPSSPFRRVLKGAIAATLAAILVACSSGGGLYGPIQGDNRPHAGVDRVIVHRRAVGEARQPNLGDVGASL